MPRRLRDLCLLLAAAALLVATAGPAAAKDVTTTGAEAHGSHLPPVVDALFLRPLGAAATVVGTGVFVATSPIFLATRPHEIHVPFRTMVLEPAVWTWGRPLGRP